MKKIFVLIVSFVLFLGCTASPALSADDVDPVVGAWCVFKIEENLHSARLLFFYPDGVMWDHFFVVENDVITSNSAKEKHWIRDSSGNLIVDSRNKKYPATFFSDDIMAVVDGDTATVYVRLEDSYTFLFHAAVKNAASSFELETGHGYVIGKDLPAGQYMFEFPFEAGRFYIYPSVESFEKDFSSSSILVGSVYDKPFDSSGDYYTDGQVIKVNQPGCVAYYFD